MGRSFFGFGCEKRVNLLSALSQLILFQCSLTHHCLIYKRPFNIHTCPWDIRQALERQLEIYWLFFFLPFLARVYLWWNRGNVNLFHLIPIRSSFATQSPFFILLFPSLSLSAYIYFCLSGSVFPSCVFSEAFLSHKYRNISLMMRWGPSTAPAGVVTHALTFNDLPAPSGERTGNRLESKENPVFLNVIKTKQQNPLRSLK